MARGDLFLQGKHADVHLARDSDWSVWFFDTPKKGKCLSVEFIEDGYPQQVIQVCSNTRAKRMIAQCKRQMNFEDLNEDN